MKKILIANRGEIAMRIMRSCREMGKKIVAVYSEPDRAAPFVSYADEAVCIGPAQASASYLNMEAILHACKQTGADAIHPGYGFLSENADFARMAEAAGIAFIGPTAESMEIMGNKLTAKAAVQKYDVPMVPGSTEALKQAEDVIEIARKTGFPVMIKAAAGGGGKGMRIVHSEDALLEETKAAMREAKAAFGDPSVFIEKYVSSPRHIEIQVLADKHGHAVHLFERECSIQRRHQKVIEEAPSSVLTPELRSEMGKYAIHVARSCGYVGAGTVEFLFDEDRQFYFLEMNTRLQVEHPVTEMITGIDLVKEQIRIASGEKIGFNQADIPMRGHAIEARVYAEDPANHFLPDTGILKRYQTPKGPGIRVDDGFSQGMEVSIHYDPMIAKLIAHAPSREEAIIKLACAIDEYHITGVETTLPFCRFAILHKAFRSGRFNTHFVKQYFKPELLNKIPDRETRAIAALFAASVFENHKDLHTPIKRDKKSKWKWRKFS